MKTLIFASLLITSVACFAQSKKEKVSCYSGNQKVSEGIRTTLTDGKIESRVSEMKYYNPKSHEVSSGQEIVIIEIERQGDLEIQKTSGTYVSVANNKPMEIRKMQSVDTYKVEQTKRTLVKSEVEGQDLPLFTVDTEIQISSHLKIYTSILKSMTEKSDTLAATYSCHFRLL